jgi:hypothetical protein
MNLVQVDAGDQQMGLVFDDGFELGTVWTRQKKLNPARGIDHVHA